MNSVYFVFKHFNVHCKFTIIATTIPITIELPHTMRRILTKG